MTAPLASVAAAIERDTMFAAYRSWKAVNASLTAQVDAAVQGEAVDWMRFDARLELWRTLQDQFLRTLKTCVAAAPPTAALPGPPDVAA
jgi:hypothetical protein